MANDDILQRARQKAEEGRATEMTGKEMDAYREWSKAQAKALIYRIEADVRLGYFFHMEADWRDVLRTASEISAENAFARACPGTDLLHVAYAKEFAADQFVSFDDDQLLLAQSAGLNAVNPLNKSALSD